MQLNLPGQPALVLRHLVLDLNGTLSVKGALIPGVVDRVTSLAERLSVHLLTADTFGTASEVARDIGATLQRVSDGQQKAALVEALGPTETVAIGNGRNDAPMLRAARLGIAILGPEGAAAEALSSADLVFASILEALDALADERLLVATLRR
jgi:P-type E1-E2 ATPase